MTSLVARWPRYDRILYPAFAAACGAYVAAVFYGAMLRQTGGTWSAPLDDVFIHFDYARATARGYPFQWSEGNGFSSGNTSLTYPFVLALGYLLFFRGLKLMVWAAIVAWASTTVFFVAVGRLLDPLGRWAKYVVPPVVLSLGALDWTLFSGMENAFHLGVWGVVLLLTGRFVALVERTDDATAPTEVAARKPSIRAAWAAGAVGAVLYVTRPESVVCVASLGVLAGIVVAKRFGRRAGLGTLVAMGVPGAIALALQAIANRVMTGEWAANGAIAKLALNNPYMTGREKWDEYVHFLKYVVLRNTQHHFSDVLPWGWLVPLVALVPLFDARVRRSAVLLWTHVIGWSLLVALNGQVRWQNERYTMPAVAWLLVLAAMGLAVLVRPLVAGSPGPASIRARLAVMARVAAAAAFVAVYAVHQAPNMRDQIWFFARASRNIRDQHVMAGEKLAALRTRRVLVGDAGALLYASDRPGLDLIGLGGYHDLPFARAAVHGLGASLELIERMPASERPDTMAIYPSWWGDLPTLFGRRITGVSVVGNVICGDSEKVIYRADWSALDQAGAPRSLKRGDGVIDELDVADLVSERAHHYEFPHPAMGFVDFHVLADPANPERDLFDAGRIIPAGATERARLAGPRNGRLVVRTIGGHALHVAVSIGERRVGTLSVPQGTGWLEASIDLPEGVADPMEVALTPEDGDWLDCHVWSVETAGGASGGNGVSRGP